MFDPLSEYTTFWKRGGTDDQRELLTLMYGAQQLAMQKAVYQSAQNASQRTFMYGQKEYLLLSKNISLEKMFYPKLYLRCKDAFQKTFRLCDAFLFEDYFNPLSFSWLLQNAGMELREVYLII